MPLSCTTTHGKFYIIVYFNMIKQGEKTLAFLPSDFSSSLWSYRAQIHFFTWLRFQTLAESILGLLASSLASLPLSSGRHLILLCLHPDKMQHTQKRGQEMPSPVLQTDRPSGRLPVFYTDQVFMVVSHCILGPQKSKLQHHSHLSHNKQMT